jgi:hypothetical protein
MNAQSLIIPSIGDDVVVTTRSREGSASLTGFVRGLRDARSKDFSPRRHGREIGRFSPISRTGDRGSRSPSVASSGVRRSPSGKLSVEDTPRMRWDRSGPSRVWRRFVRRSWQQAKAGEAGSRKHGGRDSLANTWRDRVADGAHGVENTTTTFARW